AGDRSRLADWANMRVAETFSPETNRYKGWTVGQVAASERKTPFDAMCDMVVADRLRTSFAPPPVGDDDATWKLRAQMWSDDRVTGVRAGTVLRSGRNTATVTVPGG